MDPVVTRSSMLDIQVCVPSNWKDEDVINFAEKEYPCGTTLGWIIRKQGDKRLDGANERVKCEQSNNVHIMLEA